MATKHAQKFVNYIQSQGLVSSGFSVYEGKPKGNTPQEEKAVYVWVSGGPPPEDYWGSNQTKSYWRGRLTIRAFGEPQDPSGVEDEIYSIRDGLHLADVGSYHAVRVRSGPFELDPDEDNRPRWDLTIQATIKE